MHKEFNLLVEIPNSRHSIKPYVRHVAALTVAEDELTIHDSIMAGHDVPTDYRKGFLLLPVG
jgi:hypothetical protein